LLVLFPFEPSYFLKEGLATHFVGHPVVEVGVRKAKDPSFRVRHNIPETAPVLTLLPGSRRGELSRLLPVFEETTVRLQKKYPDLRVVIPTLPHLKSQILGQFTLPVTIVTTPSEKFAAYQESWAALAASGTVSLELAAAGLPMVIAYKINPLTHFLVKRLVKVKYACLVNLLLNRGVVPEYLQEDCTAEKLEMALGPFFQKDSMEEGGYEHFRGAMREAIKMLEAPNCGTPSQCAAWQICQVMGISEG
jgi:lipid-A-disaccharide synthase